MLHWYRFVVLFPLLKWLSYFYSYAVKFEVCTRHSTDARPFTANEASPW